MRRYRTALLDNGRPRCTPKNVPFMQIARHTKDDPDGQSRSHNLEGTPRMPSRCEALPCTPISVLDNSGTLPHGQCSSRW